MARAAVDQAMKTAAARTRSRENVRKGGQEQASFVRWCDLNRGKWPELAGLFAIPNGSFLAGNPIQRAKQAARMKAEGMKQGVPDFCLPVARGGYHGLYIEMKAGEAVASKEQKGWIAFLRQQGYRAEVCRGWQAGVQLVTEYMEGR